MRRERNVMAKSGQLYVSFLQLIMANEMAPPTATAFATAPIWALSVCHPAAFYGATLSHNVIIGPNDGMSSRQILCYISLGKPHWRHVLVVRS